MRKSKDIRFEYEEHREFCHGKRISHFEKIEKVGRKKVKNNNIMKKQKFLEPIHPGDILKTEFLEIDNLTVEEIAQNTELDKKTLEKLLERKISINFKIASELGSY